MPVEQRERIAASRIARASESADAIARLVAAEDALVDSSIAFAKSNGYAPYTTTIRAAWTEAIRSLTDCLGQYLSEPQDGFCGPSADISYRTDPRFARMRQIARRHRSLGITLELYIGLFKHFRRVYLDDLASRHGTSLLRRVQDFFDETELSVTADWTASGDDRQLAELQGRMRTVSLQKDRYVAIFESLRNPAFLLDHARGLVHANHAAIELFLGEGEVGDSLYLADRRQMTKALERRIESLLDLDAESAIWLETISGRACFDVRLRPLQDAVDNTSLGYLLQLYDVTAHRLAAEQAQRAERQMSRFLATMSHEIRTPLHSVLGAADLLRASDGESRSVYLDVIQGAGQSLLQTLNNVLDYSKLEAGPPVPRPSDTDLRPALEAFRALAIVGPNASSSPLSILVDPEVPGRVGIDWAMTRQVLTNLVSNALRHDGGGGVTLRVSADELTDARVRLAFHVSDHGPGLLQEDAYTLSRPFEEAAARHTADGGAGLGLAISRYLVAAMGGEISFENTETGAHVWFTVPVEMAGAARMADGTIGDVRGSGGWRCLLVDDDAIGALITADQLRRLGCKVDRAGTLAEGKAALGRCSYDAVIADFLLPDGTGPELFSDLAPTSSAAQARKVALTANVEALRASDDLSTTFDAVLAKPVDRATLAHVLFGFGWAVGLGGEASLGARASLDGLSQETISAMAHAFRTQWQDFRHNLSSLRSGTPSQGLSEVVHRLAGSSAQLGLIELHPHLRMLEPRCHERPDAIADLIAEVDRDLEELASWRALTIKLAS